MNPELLRTELERAEEAELQSDEQLRQLVGHINKACAPNATIGASDCAKTVTAALALNVSLRARTEKLRAAVKRLTEPSLADLVRARADQHNKTTP